MNLEEYVLSHLSFYESMSIEKLILDFDHEVVFQIEGFSRESLDSILKNLCKQKKIKLIKNKETQEKSWIRLYPKRINRLVRFFIKIYSNFF